jgi:hypothetical protein
MKRIAVVSGEVEAQGLALLTAYAETDRREAQDHGRQVAGSGTAADEDAIR